MKRVSEGTTIHFEPFLYHEKWHVFNPQQNPDTISFSPNGSFVDVQRMKVTQGEWKYLGGDVFQLLVNGESVGVHLVHLDTNLLIFELGDTEQYFILVSDRAFHLALFTDLLSIEYYIQKVDLLIKEHVRRPAGSHEGLVHIIPIVATGLLFDSLSGLFHSDDDEKEFREGDGRDLNEDLFFDVDEFEDELEDLDDDNEFFEEDQVDEEPIYESEYDDYGGLTEEEVIYDYLQSEEDE